MRHAFFAINMLMATLLLAAGIYSFVPPYQAPAPLTGIIVIPIGIGMYLELRAWRRRERMLVQFLGVSCLFAGGLFLFGVVTSALEAMTSRWPADFEWLLLILTLIGVYLISCGIMRCRWSRPPKANECASCGYSLVGLSGSRCPECGAEVGGIDLRAR